MQGKVKWFDPVKGYGFIETEEGNDVYVHVKNVKEGRTYVGFDPNDVVEFEVVENKRGKMAAAVTLVPENDEK